MSDTLALLALMNKGGSGEGITEEQVNQLIDNKIDERNLQPKLTAGTNITIDRNNVISAKDTGLTQEQVNTLIDNKNLQPKLIAGDYITINGNVISASSLMEIISNDITQDELLAMNSKLFWVPDGTLINLNVYKNGSVEESTITGSFLFWDYGFKTLSDLSNNVEYEWQGENTENPGEYFTVHSTVEVGSGLVDNNGIISATLTDAQINTLIDNKNLQPKLTAGENITISADNVISATSSGGGSSYTFSDGLTETNGTVKWDLNGNIYKINNTNKMVIIPDDKSGSNSKLIIKTSKGLPDSSLYVTGSGVLDVEFGDGTAERNIIQGARSLVVGSSNGCYSQDCMMLGTGLANQGAPSYSTFLGGYNDKTNISDKILVIGNGSYSSRSTALTVDTAGNLVCNNIPAAPTTDGNYVLKCSIVSGVATYSWVAEQ